MDQAKITNSHAYNLGGHLRRDKTRLKMTSMYNLIRNNRAIPQPVKINKIDGSLRLIFWSQTKHVILGINVTVINVKCFL